MRIRTRRRGRLGTVESPERTAGIRGRDPATLDQVIREALPGLLRAARAAGLPAERAEDAAHAAILVFLQRAEAFDGRARASTWLYGILANKVAETRRADAREEGVDDIDQVFEARFDRPAADPAGRPQESLARRRAPAHHRLPPGRAGTPAARACATWTGRHRRDV
jgi:DNA-directed RNA polymerase specialized sigma24 family protein